MTDYRDREIADLLPDILRFLAATQRAGLAQVGLSRLDPARPEQYVPGAGWIHTERTDGSRCGATYAGSRFGCATAYPLTPRVPGGPR